MQDGAASRRPSDRFVRKGQPPPGRFIGEAVNRFARGAGNQSVGLVVRPIQFVPLRKGVADLVDASGGRHPIEVVGVTFPDTMDSKVIEEHIMIVFVTGVMEDDVQREQLLEQGAEAALDNS
jgi:hypothetical protein